MAKIHFQLPSLATLCGIDAPAKSKVWDAVTCTICLRRKTSYEAEAARLRAFKETQEVLIEMTVPFTEWEMLVAELWRAQYIHEIMGCMQPALAILIAQLKKARIVTRPTSNLTPKE